MSRRDKQSLRALAAAALLASTIPAHAAATPEQTCQSKRASYAAKYASCAEKALAKLNLSGDFGVFATLEGNCITKYAATWAKLQAKAATTGATCDHARFLDNGDGTVTDLLTALQWEKKTNLDGGSNFADPHDADNTYDWSATGTAADGTAFTDFLDSLNSPGGCFVGQCDWRLPTRDELRTIVTPAYPACTTPPCIDPALGPTVAGGYWSATSSTITPGNAWFAAFVNGFVTAGTPKSYSYNVRAVRSGL